MGIFTVCSSELSGTASKVLEFKGAECKLFNNAEQSLDGGATQFPSNILVGESQL